VSEPVVVLIMAGSQQEAERIAHTLVAEMLAAAVNIVSGVNSVYRWQEEIRHAQEWLLIAKSRYDVLDELIRRVQAPHSYDVPKVIALPLAGGSIPYLRWLDGEIHGSWHALD
jgi:periplasmic divalent cation tolerance protein